MKSAFPNIITIGTFDSRCNYPADKKTEPRTVCCYELEYFFVDSGVSVLNDVPYKLTKGSILFARPGDIRYSYLPVACRFVHFNIESDELICSLDEISSFFSASEHQLTEEIFGKILSLFHSGKAIDNMAASAELLLILRSLSIKRSQNVNLISYAQKFIEENYHKNLSAEDIASECNVSVSYLHQMFKRRLNTTPGDYLCGCRISAARSMLINTTLPFGDISFKCGFNSQSYFSYCFKQHIGLSPSEYRKKYRGVM
jgi:AraC-like DNA-binding protein